MSVCPLVGPNSHKGNNRPRLGTTAKDDDRRCITRVSAAKLLVPGGSEADEKGVAIEERGGKRRTRMIGGGNDDHWEEAPSRSNQDCGIGMFPFPLSCLSTQPLPTLHYRSLPRRVLRRSSSLDFASAKSRTVLPLTDNGHHHDIHLHATRQRPVLFLVLILGTFFLAFDSDSCLYCLDARF